MRVDAESVLRRGWKLDACYSIVGLTSTAAISILWGLDVRNVILAPFLAFTVPLAIFPWFEYCADSCFLFKKQNQEWGYVQRLDMTFVTISFLFALAASWGVLMEDVASNLSKGYFCPTSWPVDPFHFVSVSFISAIVNYRFDREHAWYELFSLITGIISSSVLLLAVKSFTNEWYIGADWIDRVYEGTTEPFPRVSRITYASLSNRSMFYGRFACAVACAALEFASTFARGLRFSLSRCGSKRERGHSFSFPPIQRACTTQTLASILKTFVLFIVILQLLLSLSPYPQWIVHDSRHVALIAALTYFCLPSSIDKEKDDALIPLLALGIVSSTFSTVREFHLVSLALARTQDAVSAVDPDAPFLITIGSIDAYAREFRRASASFSFVYQYADYDDALVPRWFATTSAMTHGIDAAICVLASALFAYVAWTTLRIRKLYLACVLACVLVSVSGIVWKTLRADLDAQWIATYALVCLTLTGVGIWSASQLTSSSSQFYLLSEPLLLNGDPEKHGRGIESNTARGKRKSRNSTSRSSRSSNLEGSSSSNKIGSNDVGE
jgi:hypothetical protein